MKFSNHICPVCGLSKYVPGRRGKVMHPKCSRILQEMTKDVKRKKPKTFGAHSVDYLSKTQ